MIKVLLVWDEGVDWEIPLTSFGLNSQSTECNLYPKSQRKKEG
jgi:hypothetical protein